jgi:peptidoglycan/LPS O-acetylase OafA/YrhL
MSNAGFFPFIHMLRGIAPLMVLWAHLVFYWLVAHNINTWSGSGPWYYWVVSPFHLYQNGGHLGVVIFFLVSGFVITYRFVEINCQSYYRNIFKNKLSS